MPISRRGLLAGLPLLLAGCASTYNEQQNYAAVPEEEFPLHRVPIDKIKPELRRQQVAFSGNYAPGTVVVDTPARRAYYVLGGGQAIRYGVGVGRAGMALSGNAYVGRKAEWPSWTPTPAMQRREERYRKLAGGMAGGPNNPLGARAMYLYRGGNDTLFRLHGTNQPESIGHAMSSGCIRMMNHDVIDLYNRVQVGAKVVVIQA